MSYSKLEFEIESVNVYFHLVRDRGIKGYKKYI